MLKKLLVILFVMSVIGGGIFYIFQMRTPGTDGTKPSVQNAAAYGLNLLGGSKYASGSVEKLQLDVKNQAGVPVKDFADMQGYPLHLFVYRSDRSGFQHIHPSLDKATGVFSQDITFPLDGEYRLYAKFTEIGKTEMNLKSKLTVGSIEGYEPPQAFNINKSAAVSDGFIASFYFPPNDDSVGPPNTDFFAEAKSTLLISIQAEGQTFKNLESFHDSLGTLTIIGPDLEPMPVNANYEEGSAQTGLLSFDITFPKAGYYKIFLETKAKQKVTQFNFALTVKDNQVPTTNNN